MKKLISILSLVLALAVALTPALAQTTNSNLITTTTSLAAALTSSANSLRVASATGISANTTILFIQDGNGGNSEAVFVNSVSGTTIGITRGYNGTQTNAHLSGSVVLVGPAGNGPFVNTDLSGSCDSASAWYPTVNIFTSNQFICSSISSSWVPGFFNTSRPAGVSTAVASVAGATNPSGPLFHITGTNAITAWGSSTTAGLGDGGGSATQPYGAPFCVIPDAAYTTTATNNIGKATTAVAGRVQCWTFDGTTKTYFPSYN